VSLCYAVFDLGFCVECSFLDPDQGSHKISNRIFKINNYYFVQSNIIHSPRGVHSFVFAWILVSLLLAILKRSLQPSKNLRNEKVENRRVPRIS
jgi:hypothetical protein